MSDDGERLQLGRSRTAEPTPEYDEDASFFQRFVARRRAKRAAKKARLAAMSRGRRIARWGMIAGTWMLGFVAAGMVALIVMYYAFTDVPRPETLPLPQVVTIQYADGSTLAKVGSVDRTVVKLEQVPEHVRWAVLAAEDRNFYSEPGVSIKGTLRAAVSDLTGGDTQGGSGITQQYVKNAYLSSSRTLTRKIKELMIALKLSREYSKDQILEFYLNTVYFGRGAYGIQAAARAFFGVNVQDLSVAQGALLAGLLRAPSYYDPANNPQAAQGRWKYVLDGMVKTGHLTDAQEAQLKFPKTKTPRDSALAPSGWKALLVHRVFAELQADVPNSSENQFYAQGLTIRTTITKRAQTAALKAIRDNFKGLTKKQRNLKAALVAVNPDTGGILAYYGGTGPGVKGPDGQVNYNDWAGGVNSAHPAGSAFKPYVLATALGDTLKKTKNVPHVAIDSDVPGNQCKKIDGTKICNDPSDSVYASPSIKLALAMKYSLNTTFDWLAWKLGPSKVADTAHTMGVSKTLPNDQKSLQDSNGQTTFGIGIGDYSVTPIDQAAGFATLANGGKVNAPFLVQSATTSGGDPFYRHHDNPKQAIDKKVANDVTLTLKPVADFSGDGLAGGRQSAAKTGTAGISKTNNGNSDAWMVGFTPQVSTSVWVGTGYRKPIYDANGNPMYGRELPGQTWKEFMDLYLQGKPNLPLPDKQQIAANGGTPSPTPTPSKTSSSAAPSSSAPTSSVASSPTPTPTKSSVKPSPSPSPSVSSSATCGGILSPCSSSPAGGGGGAGGGAGGGGGGGGG